MSDVFTEAVSSHAPGRFSPEGLEVIHQLLLEEGEPLPDPKLVAEQWAELDIYEALTAYANACSYEITAETSTRGPRPRLSAVVDALSTKGRAAAVEASQTIVTDFVHNQTPQGESL